MVDRDEVLLAVERDAARQEQEAAQRGQRTRDELLNEFFRELLNEEFDAELLEIAEGKLKPATQSGYAGEYARLIRWCEDFGVSCEPASPEVVGAYLAEHLENGASYPAIKRMHAGISYMHRVKGLPDPCPGPDPAEDADPYDCTSRPYPAAVLMRARREWKQKLAEAKEAERGVSAE